MIIILKSPVSSTEPSEKLSKKSADTSEPYQAIVQLLKNYPQIEVKTHTVFGANQESAITELYLFGDTHLLSQDQIESLPGVEKVIRISQEYKIMGRHQADERNMGFEYNGIEFSQDNLNIFAGLCAVDNKQNVERVMKALAQNNMQCTRMGAYKPRTSPYAFQGLGKPCLEYVFECAGKYGIKVIAMEITHERHIHEIDDTLQKLGNPCGVMLQIGTRNAQNFELLKAVGSQKTYPILFKRGFGITLDESLNAAEYLAHAGNQQVVFCLRGVKSLFGSPHRNLADFAHIPVIKRLTRMPVCIDPSHSIGCTESAPDGINDIFHATAQGIISGANMVLVDFHPAPAHAVVDAKQALCLDHLEWYLEDIQIALEAYQKRKKSAEKYSTKYLEKL